MPFDQPAPRPQGSPGWPLAAVESVTALLEALPLCVKLLDREGRLLEMNRTGLSLLEAESLAELKGRSLAALVVEQDRPAFSDLIERVFRGESAQLEFEIVGLKGTRRWLETQAVPLRDASGKVLALLAVTADITSRKLAQEATREAREWLAALIQSVDGIVWEAEADTLRFTFVSQRAERLLGYPLRQWTEEADFWARHLHPEDRERALSYCLQCTAELRDHEFEYRMLAADGRTVWLRDCVTVVAEGGRAVRLRGIIVDITARKLAEQRLLELNRVYALLTAVNQLIVREENDQALLEKACALAVELGGFAAACVMKRNGGRFEVVASAGASEEVLAQIRAIHQDPALGCAFSARAAESGERAVCNEIATDPLALPWREAALAHGYRSMASFPIVVSRDWIGVLNLYSRLAGYFEGPELALLDDLALDITFALQARALARERSQAQEQLRASEQRLRQVQKLEALGRLAGGVAHDFNNVLAAILMQAEMALETAELTESVRDDLRGIHAAAERAARLTRQLLLFARQQGMEPRPLDINEAVANLSRLLQRLLGEEVRLQLDLFPGALVAHCDPAMLDQVLLNLAINARDAMPQGGCLRIETDLETLDEARASSLPDVTPGQYARISVSDDGVGMAPDLLPKIFEPFFTTKEVGKGTGLGLSTAFGIVRQHGGWIDVDSTLGKGSTFHVFLPLSGAPRQELP
jgi:PAS domain S-box-containing protein